MLLNVSRIYMGLKGSVLLVAMMLVTTTAMSQLPAPTVSEIDSVVNIAMKEGGIPGLTLVVEQAGVKMIRYYGYADKEQRIPVTARTGFELGSCSKAFTALAVLKLLSEHKIGWDDDITRYLPWLKISYEKKPERITIAQLLHHTSGIPWSSISGIPPGNSSDMLTKTVHTLQRLDLANKPGEVFEYATINYDILGFIVAQVSGQNYEQFVTSEIIQPLGLKYILPLAANTQLQMASGYKAGFFHPIKYEAPAFRGNTPAGYIVSNGTDLQQWLSYQLGTDTSPLDSLITASHRRDETVAPLNLFSYALGWQVSLAGDNVISHSGLNPGFSSYIGFVKAKKTGIAILTNANSNYPPVLGAWILARLTGHTEKLNLDKAAGNDKIFSLIALALLLYILVLIVFVCWSVGNIFSGKRKYRRMHLLGWLKLLGRLAVSLPLLYGLYVLPQAISKFTWASAIVWTPFSFPVMILLFALAVCMTCLTFTLITLYPANNPYLQAAPPLVILSLMSGISNMILIVFITSSVNSNVELKYLLLYFGITFFIYIAGRKIVQTSLTKLTVGIVYDLRMNLIRKIFATSYQNFEKIERGRLYATLDDDTGTLGSSAAIIINLITSIITVTAAFIYLAAIAFWATLITITTIVIIASVYYVVSKKANRSFTQARDAANKYMSFLNGLIDGYKELSIHRIKKQLYQQDIENICTDYKEKLKYGQIRFINAFLVGEMLLIVVLAAVAFILPLLFPDIREQQQFSFIVVLLYLIGPVNAILNAIPQFMHIKISWKRIRDFQQDIPSDLSPEMAQQVAFPSPSTVDSYRVQEVSFYYPSEVEKGFAVETVSFELKRGEVLFIIGGNGSGKTTLSKVLTGLYAAAEGGIFINELPVGKQELGEYFSAVFNPLYLFNKLYNGEEEEQSEKIAMYLKLFGLEEKVTISNQGVYSTIKLSSGQRKRLALLECYLENRPIYLFDEWAVDQDPEFRWIFYKELLPKMRAEGKIIIAITHDDHYFDVADYILKLNRGKVESLSSYEKVNLSFNS